MNIFVKNSLKLITKTKYIFNTHLFLAQSGRAFKDHSFDDTVVDDNTI